MAIEPPYAYRAVVARIVDGDTIVPDIDLGFGLWLHATPEHPLALRLAGCNTIERHKPGGPEARAYLESILPIGLKVLLRSIATDKYGGRYVVRIATPTIPDVSEHLIAEGWAARWDGRGAAPVPPWPRPATA